MKDLRVEKTIALIDRVFLEVRAHNPLERVKVKDICDMAMINKSTFYRYYTDVFDLSDKVEERCLDRIWETFPSKGLLFTEPEKFVGELIAGFEREDDVIRVIYDGRMDRLIDKVEKRCMAIYATEDSRLSRYLLTFFIGGAVRLFMPFGKSEMSEKAAFVGEMVRRLT